METTLKKGQVANVGKYSYQYVDIAQIHDYLESVNAKYIQQIKRIDESDYIMTKRCFNDVWEDEWLQGARVVDATLQGVKNPAQEQGSALTYARRYSLLMAFGLATEDDDAQSLSREIELTKEEAEKYTLTFGKYQGKTIKEIEKEDKKYIDWLFSNTKDETIIKVIELTTNRKMPTEEESKQRIELMVKLNELVEETECNYNELLDHYGVSTNNQMTIAQLQEAIKVLEKRLK